MTNLFFSGDSDWKNNACLPLLPIRMVLIPNEIKTYTYLDLIFLLILTALVITSLALLFLFWTDETGNNDK